MIPYSRYYRLYLLISGFFLLLGLYFIFTSGFGFSVEFTGGARVQYKIDTKLQNQEIIKKTQSLTKLTPRLENEILFLQGGDFTQSQETDLRNKLAKELGSKVELIQFENVGPSVGQETVQKTLIAVALATLGIMAYIAYAFKSYHFALSAVVALAHDLLIILGAQAVMGHFWGAPFDLMFVSALLTTMSFSVHDTIVIFDKLREYRRQGGKLNQAEQADKAVNETMRRSIYNSLTAFIMLLALLILGGTTIRFFVAALLVGVITGTYSSPFVSVPFYVWLSNLTQHRK